MFSITVPKTFVRHCLSNIPGVIYEICYEFCSQKLGNQFFVSIFSIWLFSACFKNESEVGASRAIALCNV